MELSISNVINIQVSQPGAGLSNYNTSNVALFTREPSAPSFGSDDYKIYLEPGEVEKDFGTSSDTYKMALAMFAQQPNIKANNGYLVIIPFDDIYGTETLAAAINRTKDSVQYFGIMSAQIETEFDILAAAAVVQAELKMLFVVADDAAAVEPGGTLDLLRTGGLSHTRGLLYLGSDDISCLRMMAAYVGRGLSVNFQGSNTTSTMHLKDLITIQPDPLIDQTILNKAKLAGADCYVSIRGVPKVFCSGANEFFDDVYNLLWYVGDLEVAGFNLLAQVSTKIPQTEQGMDQLKGAYRRICEQALVNQFLAPGAWTSPTTFGVQEDFFSNIIERGYYIYSSPIATQNVGAREAREAPLVQIAIKYAGAIHSSTVIVNINK